MRDKSKCPFFDEKKGECKLIDITKDLTDINRLLAEIAEAYAPQKIAPSPIPSKPSDGFLEGFSKILPKVFHPPSEGSPAYFGEEEDQKEKQQYWEKELKKMDEKKEK